jgi:hypothetical protein
VGAVAGEAAAAVRSAASLPSAGTLAATPVPDARKLTLLVALPAFLLLLPLLLLPFFGRRRY